MMLVSSLLRSASSGTEPQSTCFVCGPAHASGLRIRYGLASDRSVEARWTPNRSWEGHPGIVHGGIVSTILDEAMSKAVAARGCEALTAELKVRFRRPIAPGQEVSIRGWVLDHFRRRLRTEAVVTGADGQEFARAWGTFLIFNGGGPAAGTGAGAP